MPRSRVAKPSPVPTEDASSAVEENFHPIRRQTLTGMTLDALRERILRGQFPEGKPLRLNVFAGMDDMIVEAIVMGASGWIAGLVNALPAESVELVRLASAGKIKEARAIYDWFLPLLRLDTVPEFVQYIKFVQQEMNCGSALVRPPRLELQPSTAAETRTLLQDHLSRRPSVKSRPMAVAAATI